MKYIAKEHHGSELTMAKDLYGSPALQISEVIGMMPATSMPEVFETPQNVIKYQGEMVPLMDLRMNLGMFVPECVEQVCMLVMESVETKESFMMAVLVDSERDVYELVMGTTH